MCPQPANSTAGRLSMQASAPGTCVHTIAYIIVCGDVCVHVCVCVCVCLHVCADACMFLMCTQMYIVGVNKAAMSKLHAHTHTHIHRERERERERERDSERHCTACTTVHAQTPTILWEYIAKVSNLCTTATACRKLISLPMRAHGENWWNFWLYSSIYMQDYGMCCIYNLLSTYSKCGPWA